MPLKTPNGSGEIPCPLCGNSDEVSLAFRRNESAVHSCRRCSLEFLFPQPTDETLSSIYSSEYFLGSNDKQAALRQGLLKRATAKLYLDALRPFIRKATPRLLEIGCGSGDFLIEAQSCGFEVEGLEYSEHAAADANARLGRQAVRVGSPEARCLPESTYDIIGAFDVIEHLRNPKRSLEYLHTALKPGGLIAIVTPSLDSWSRQLLGRHWMEYKTEHLTYFGRKSLVQLLETAGFKNVRFFSNYKTLSFDYISAHFDRFRVPVASPVLRVLRKALPAALAYRPIKVVASGVMALAEKRD